MEIKLCVMLLNYAARNFYCHTVVKFIIEGLYKNPNHQQMHIESFIINRNTLLHFSTLLGHLQEDLFVTVTLALHIQFSENVLLTVCCLRPGPQTVHASKNNAVHSQQHILTQI
jgi:hypothetical protein